MLFTSGSTGVPQAHLKTWAATTVIARHLAQRLLGGARAQIVATVPPQHMYGLETTVLMALAADCVVHGGRPFRSEEHTSELQSLMRRSNAVFCLKKKQQHQKTLIRS